ncbi:ABC transporter transmembrane domain-containing protein [Sphingomonas sanguinis]|jgi:ATP-binding cassette subfamily B protein|uniref:ATP-binding cassette domain-containing protein n=3 Tax=Sphingomonas sanguinis TaxID=33051 RepID=A0A7Y7QSQ3_9SPHN|nr:ABC transporter transmembrane domain-containing protein [Sphingomonas sanguinis]MBZ6380690.1 ATP-binding cassette domain-containing protein [Sphingomonas sanguinis]NNG49499.1 ATP-binding cassette domain-containing protein [Sphingomonas sanguinis]NNG53323.1 ATP-binding cassette domain-containing protein [Sphingomonas sanguinis]NVP29992.1 ATP-binding cassette domain-containing protein [Sphingomonas sanguinis]
MARPAASPQSAPIPASRRLSNLKMVWRYTLRYPAQIVAASVSLAVAALATLFIPRTFQKVIDHGFGKVADTGDIAPYFQGLLAVVVVLAIATAFRFYFVSWLGERTVADIRIAVQANLLRLAPRYFEENRPSEIASRLTADTAIIEQVVGSTVSIALRNTVIGIGGTIYLFALSPKLTLSLLVCIPVIVLPIVLLGKRVRGYSRDSQDRLADIGATAVETLGAMKVVQAFGQERREAERFELAVSNGFATSRKRFLLRALMTAMVIGLFFGGLTLLLWEAVADVASGRLSGGSLTAFVVTGMLVAGSFQALTEVWGDILRASGAAQRLAELLAEQPEIAPPPAPAVLPVIPMGALRFEHVVFHYPTRPEVAALNDFSLDVRPGETVAVVGPSGAGKSTLFQLAERFYDPQDGNISLDGVSLRDADPAAIRARIAMVPQETVIFGASARDNLRYGRWEASDDELWAAAEAANAADFLRALPQGLDTFLGEGGARLSGGQRQRITIARALLRDAPILLLDEATSALDAESEQLVQQALERLMANRTTLVIAHRLATVRAAERIVVMDGGRIVEQGRHAELIANGGLYARLASLQFHD